ncbi:MAG: BON domain-containing protein [Gammaproteobacteria bacterium]|nr:BON domain-containing protein [Gammaproteobacteria bacterium]
MRLSREADLDSLRTQSVVGPRKPKRGRKRELLLLGLLGVLVAWLFHNWSHISLAEGDLKAKTMRALVGTNIDSRQVSVNDRKVTLRGSVPFEGLRNLVAESVAAVEGVRGVNNELTVAASVLPYVKSN